MVSKSYSRIKVLLYEINTKYMNHLRIWISKEKQTAPAQSPMLLGSKTYTPRNSMYVTAVPKITINCSSQDSMK